ncbi:MAG: hypothetical protein GY852_00035, partial [bacterium]|nr:hypothetical protein [bacterium]
MHLNNIIKQFKDSDDEFLPAWKKKEAGTAIDLSGARLPEGPLSMADVASTVEKLIPADEQPAWMAVLEGIVDQSGLNQFLRSLYERAQQPEQQSEALPMEQPQVFEPEYGADEPLELASKLAKQGSITQTVAKFGYGSGDRWQVKFNNGVGVTAYVAETPIQKASGLEVFETLAPKEGLLFPFDEPDRVTFHMGSVEFPIDIIFLTSADLPGLEVGKIIHNVQPGVPDQWSHPDTVAVLEVNGGKCKEFGIDIGATCFLNHRVQSV